jgi:hypothetical protein
MPRHPKNTNASTSENPNASTSENPNASTSAHRNRFWIEHFSCGRYETLKNFNFSHQLSAGRSVPPSKPNWRTVTRRRTLSFLPPGRGAP